MIHQLQYAARTGRPVTIIYLDDSQLFSKRVVRIISWEEKYIRVFCYTKGSYRTFKRKNILAFELLNEQLRGSAS